MLNMIQSSMSSDLFRVRKRSKKTHNEMHRWKKEKGSSQGKRTLELGLQTIADKVSGSA